MFDSTRYRKRSPENTQAGAKAYELVLRQKLARGESIEKLAIPEDQLFENFAWRWFTDYVIPNNKHSEQRTKKYVISTVLVPFFGKISVGKITSHQIEQFKARMNTKGVGNKTVKNYLTVLNKCLGTAYEWLQLDGTPPKIKWPKCNPARTDFLSPDECELLLKHSEGVVREMILIALRTGMRQGEIKGLQWNSISWENRSVAVRHSRDDRMKMLVSPKSNRERHVPLDADVYEILYARKNNTGYVFLDTDKEPFDYHRMERRLTKACNDAGIRKVGWHILRHTFASHLAMKGVPMTAVQQLMGHSNITTTMRYSHLAPSTLRAAIDMLNPKTMVIEEFRQPVVNQWMRMQQLEATEKILVPKNL
ncbi:MAG: Site-specific recombinase, phage integrase family protein [Candidatus Kaiserbacteria bacterium GW2011_GWA2_52_12]|uniref:Site-specific recombinase, phage integrase family protein n=1 Tax=Candidatus Kaiserbacteria bacterium GW2011_GWA2_52_12 TaxID=1618671 RepID=A0A0G1WVW6_9BACT|nr:MAG: Site-specific recombinase, phage integrase family protein [Candidatus Kaiserbacteria bacterium GW2011_GWA2_52_12]